ncbi:ArsR/SmtB family transcription factor [Methanolobus profundi]|uniref:Regulatory protein, arsR family n=1 Tax=Methanolobus profundi TaxID=487685 RepID=A0A1I4PH76_9EURY|nr:winged helix-turn-helix domain-containing protein [Methanolobus profundi]SFM27098.1 regulatory protein, arsR family [Methanolobus profundi]
MSKNDTFTKAIVNEKRVKILQALSAKDMHITELASELGVSGTSISKHIRILEDADLVKRNIYGKSHVFSLTKRTDNNMNNDKELSYMELHILQNLFLI